MTAHFTLTLDTAPPANPALLLNGGAVMTGSQDVLLTVTTTDYDGGSHDVQEMKVWGDVDPTAHPAVQVVEADSDWMVYAVERVIRLSAGPGRKWVRARLKDDVCNVTPEFADFIDLDLTVPVVSITTPADRSRISTTAPCDKALFVWQSSLPFTAYEVRVVPSPGSPHMSGVPIGTALGSANTSGVGSFPALTGITTVIDGSDLEAAAPGDTAKVCKVFVRDENGVWSA